MAERALSIALMLESDGPAGAEFVLYRLASELRRRGHSVHPIGPAHGVGWLGRELRAAGFETHTFHVRHFADLRCLWELVRLVRRLRVDVMHGHDFDGAVYGTAAAWIAGRPSVITMHGNQSMTAAWRRRVGLRWAFRHAARVVAVSAETKEQLERDLRLRRDAVQIVRNGVPSQAGDPRPVRAEFRIDEGDSVILAIGSLVRRKGHAVLLEALRRLDERRPELRWRLVIAGGPGGDQKSVLEAFAEKHGLSDRTDIVLYRDDVPNLIAAADVVAMPSLWEGFPLAILEAMVAGTAVIASDVCGIPEAIVSEQEGLLTPPGDAEALSVAIERVLTDGALRERLGAGARARALREFTVEAMADAYEGVYRVAVDRGAGAQG